MIATRVHHSGDRQPGATKFGHRAIMASAPTIWGPYMPVESIPILSAVIKDSLFQTVGHADLFRDANSDWWIVALASRVVGKGRPNGCETVLMKVDWSGDAPVVDTKAIDYPVSHLTETPKETGIWDVVLAPTGGNEHHHPSCTCEFQSPASFNTRTIASSY
jgi:beta-xylosidase